MAARFFFVLLIAATLPCEGWANESPPDPPTPVALGNTPPPAAHPQLSPLLNQLYDSFFGRPNAIARAGLGHLMVDGRSTRVVAVCRPHRASAAAARARRLGGEVTGVYRDLVFATLPITRLPRFARDPAVLRLRTPYRSRPDIISEGVGLHSADVLHGQGVAGDGVKIGVIDCAGFSDYEALLGVELPAQVTLWTGGSDPVGPGIHGTACAEIVHDMAPGAQLYLAHDGEEADFYTAVDWLIDQQVDVISYSCGWLDAFPGDGGGDPHNPVNQKVVDARAAGVLFVTSSGNYAADKNYQGWFEAYPGSNWHSFNGDSTNLCYLRDGSERYVTLTWNDWPEDPLTQGSTQDYDMDLWVWDGSNWSVIASSENPQNGSPGQLPFEEFSLTPPVSEWYAIAIRAVATTGSHFLSLRSFSANFIHFNPEHSCYTPETPAGLLVGATFWNGLELETFSSQGPIFGPGGTPDGGPLAPHIVGTDGVSTVTYGSSDGVPYPDGTGFFGTSAACPHVAGGAALLLSDNPSLTVDDLSSLLLASAVDMGTAGPDNQYGHGFMSLSGWVFADGFDSGTTSAWSTAVP